MHEVQEGSEKGGVAARKRSETEGVLKMWSESDFSAHMWASVSDASRPCAMCVEAAAASRDSGARKEVKVCVACEVAQPQKSFSARMWTDVADRHRKCAECLGKVKAPRGWWSCVACKGTFEKAEFGSWLATRTVQKPKGTQRCNKCFADQERERKRVAERSVAAVTKTRRTG